MLLVCVCLCVWECFSVPPLYKCIVKETDTHQHVSSFFPLGRGRGTLFILQHVPSWNYISERKLPQRLTNSQYKWCNVGKRRSTEWWNTEEMHKITVRDTESVGVLQDLMSLVNTPLWQCLGANDIQVNCASCLKKRNNWNTEKSRNNSWKNRLNSGFGIKGKDCY